MNDAPAGSEIVLPSGVYRFEAPTSSNGKPLSIRGVGHVTILRDYPVGPTPVIQLDGDRSTIDNIRFEGSFTHAEYDAIYATLQATPNLTDWAAVQFLQADNCTASNLWFEGCVIGAAASECNQMAFRTTRTQGVFDNQPQTVLRNLHVGVHISGGIGNSSDGNWAEDCGTTLLVGRSAADTNASDQHGLRFHDHVVYYSSAVGGEISGVVGRNNTNGTGSVVTARGDNLDIGGVTGTNVNIGLSLSGLSFARVRNQFGGRGMTVSNVSIDGAQVYGVQFNDSNNGGFYLTDVTASGLNLNNCAIDRGTTISGTADNLVIDGATITDHNSTNPAVALVGADSSPNPQGIHLANMEIMNTVGEGIWLRDADHASIVNCRGRNIGDPRFILLTAVTNSNIVANRSDSGRIDEDAASDSNLIAGNLTPAVDVYAGTNHQTWDVAP